MSATMPKPRGALLILIGAMTALGPLGTDLYLPGLPAVTADLGTTDSMTQFTLLIYLLGLGLGQFVWGPVADRLGRRRPLLLGLGIFIISGIICAITPTIEVLLIARLLQGLSGSAGLVISRAIVRDLYEGRELTRIFGLLAIIFGLAPIVGPIIGAGIIQFAGWRGTFVALAVLGAIFLALTLVLLPETLDTSQPRPASRWEAWLAPLRHQVFLTNALLMVASSTVMFSYVTYVPFVLQVERGIDDVTFAWLFALNAVAVLVGGRLAGLLARRIPGRTVVRAAYGIAVVATTFILLSLVLDWPVWAFLVALWIMTLQIATIQPTAIALAIEPFARGAGTASAILGGMQFLGASLITALVSAAFGSHGAVMGVLLLASVSIAFIIAIVGPLLRRSPRAGAAG